MNRARSLVMMPGAVGRPLRPASSRFVLTTPRSVTRCIRAYPRQRHFQTWHARHSATAAPSTTALPDQETTSKERDSGHFTVNSNESIIFFDNIFPVKFNSFFGRIWQTDGDVTDLLRRFENSSLAIVDPIRLVKMAIPSNTAVKVTEILPRLKDGGAYVKFEHEGSVDAAELESIIHKRLKEKPIKPWFNPFRSIRASLVRGSPWLEDLYRFPSSTIRVDFVPSEPGKTPQQLSEEALYTLFRRYGRIAEFQPQPADSKVEPRFARVLFPSVRDAIMARNCLHGFIVGEDLGGGKDGTKLRIFYEKRVNAHSIWNWLTNHPRLVIPILAALLAGISVVVFDPIREFFVKFHVQYSQSLTDLKFYKWIKNQTDKITFLGHGRKRDQHPGLEAVWDHRRDLIDQIRNWLSESSDTFIVVTGPRGSGKVEMIMDQALEGRKNVLLIDSRPIVEGRGENGIIKRMAVAVGYRPLFSTTNRMSSMIDLAVQSTTGVKAGFSETFEAQFTKILHTTTDALKQVALSYRSNKDKDAGLTDDAYLEAHPEARPVVVIDNFMHKSEEKSAVYDKMAEWAASMVQNNVAHVIFLSNDSTYTKPLAKALPDRVFRTISLGDLELDVAKNFVLSRLEEQNATDDKRSKKAETEKTQPVLQQAQIRELDDCIKVVGGRLTDLEFLSRRIKTGQTPKEAVDEIVDESATDIVKMFLQGKITETEKTWSTPQVWHIIKSLAQNDVLRYNQVLLSPPFASSLTKSASDGEAALEGLANAELILITSHQGRPQTIQAGKPLYQAAFTSLMKDRVLKAKMDLAILSEMVKVEGKTIDTAENELALLGGLPKQTGETSGRIEYLLSKLDTSQKKITTYEKDIAVLKKVLNEEY